MTTYRSKPRAMCVDLFKTLLTEHHVFPQAVRIERARGAIDGFHISHRGAVIWQAAHDAGLPTAVITDLPYANVKAAIQALPCNPDLLIASEDNDQNDGRPALLERAAECLGIEAGDILYVGDAAGFDIETPASVGMRTCAGDGAVKQLQMLNIHRCRALLSDRDGDDAGLAHTVLLPLDLNIYDIEDTELFRRRCHFIFDTASIIEGLVPTSGLSLKTIQKNIAGHVILLYGLGDYDDEPNVKEIVREQLHRIRHGGPVKVILLHTENLGAVDQHNIGAIAEDLGYDVKMQTWKPLMSRFDRDHICEI